MMSNYWNNAESLVSELAGMESAGLPLPDGLAVAAQQARRRDFRSFLEQAFRSCQNGASVGETLERAGSMAPPIVASMIRAGEAGGNMLQALRGLADYFHGRRRLFAAMRASLLYPMILLLFATGISWFLTYEVFPALYGQIEAFHVLMPSDAPAYPGRIAALFGVQRIMVVVFAVMAAAFVFMVCASWIAPGSREFQVVTLRLPVFGRLFRNYLLYHFAGVLRLMLVAHVPLVDALRNLRDMRESPLLSEPAAHAIAALEQGRPLADGLAGATWLPTGTLWLIRKAEERDQLEECLDDMRRRCLESLEYTGSAFLQTEAPIIFVAGVAVGIYAVSAFVPAVCHFKMMVLGG